MKDVYGKAQKIMKLQMKERRETRSIDTRQIMFCFETEDGNFQQINEERKLANSVEPLKVE